MEELFGDLWVPPGPVTSRILDPDELMYMNPEDCYMADLLGGQTGYPVKNMDAPACYYRSREICLDESCQSPGTHYVYFEERRNQNESHVGYSLAYCLVNNELPEQLVEEGKQVAEYFINTIDGDSLFWHNGASIGNAYNRNLIAPDFENRFQGSRCLWVMIGGSNKSMHAYVPYLFPFKEAVRTFDIDQFIDR